jgi:hypothetical protein
MADWAKDPTGKHQLRYHDGTQWTEHVATNGAQSTDPMPDQNPSAGQGGGELHAVHSVHSMQPTSDVTVWQGERRNLTHAATSGKMVSAKYRMTEDGLYFEQGLLSSAEEIIPLWAIVDVDVRQSMTQKARGVGNCVVHLDTKGFNYGQSRVVLESVDDPKQVRDTIARYANARRSEMLEYQHSKEVHKRQAGATAIHMQGAVAPAPEASAPSNAGKSLAEELRELAELRDAGILTEDEFAAQKARILESR